MKYPIPKDALDDRLAILGTAGSGKTYMTLGAIEHLLEMRARVVIVDPLGVCWGLRLNADGKTPSGFKVPIFGGRHGDLPLNEYAGALIGETVATMHESCIVDLSELATKAAERRFMTAFLEAIWRFTDPQKVEPYHLIFDEADRFAPQKPPKGDETMLGRMEEIVRRGRVRGFTPWLITQRPAVLNKNVLSQADGLVMLKLTASQDRDQVGAWIEGQADRAEGRAILGSLPAMQTGHGVVWIPGRGILETVAFPTKRTFDSSRTPKRGEKRQRAATLDGLDIEALRTRLATVEAETKANDPKELKAEIERLKKLATNAVNEDARAAALAAAEQSGYANGHEQGFKDGARAMRDEYIPLWEAAKKAMGETNKAIPPYIPMNVQRPENPVKKPTGQLVEHRPLTSRVASPAAGGNSSLSRAEQRALDAIAWWHELGAEAVDRARAAVVCGLSPKASTFGVYCATLINHGLAEPAGPRFVRLTPRGMSQRSKIMPRTNEALLEIAKGLLNPRAGEAFMIVYNAHPKEISRDHVAERLGLSPTASTTGVYLSEAAGYGLIESPTRGFVRAAGWLFLER